MRREDVPAEWLALAEQHGIDPDTLPAELSDADLEAVLGGKGPVFIGGPGFGGFGGFGPRPFVGRPFVARPFGPRWWW